MSVHGCLLCFTYLMSKTLDVFFLPENKINKHVVAQLYMYSKIVIIKNGKYTIGFQSTYSIISFSLNRHFCDNIYTQTAKLEYIPFCDFLDFNQTNFIAKTQDC